MASLDVTKYSFMSDEELVRTTYCDMAASEREMSLAIRLGDALDMISELEVDDEKLNS